MWGDRRRRKVARRRGKCSSSSSSCRCQCPPSCYPRRGPLKDIGADHGGSSVSQPVLLVKSQDNVNAAYIIAKLHDLIFEIQKKSLIILEK